MQDDPTSRRLRAKGSPCLPQKTFEWTLPGLVSLLGGSWNSGAWDSGEDGNCRAEMLPIQGTVAVPGAASPTGLQTAPGRHECLLRFRVQGFGRKQRSQRKRNKKPCRCTSLRVLCRLIFLPVADQLGSLQVHRTSKLEKKEGAVLSTSDSSCCKAQSWSQKV